MHKLPLLLSLLAATASAQTPCVATVKDLVAPTAIERLNQLRAPITWTGDVTQDGAQCSAVDSTNRVLAHIAWAQLRLVQPVLRTVSVGGVPDARNNGPFWNGRGLNLFARAGVSVDFGNFHATLAPELGWSENRPFNFFPDTAAGRSPFASNWYNGSYSLDMPSRFGAAPITQILPGQSAAWYSKGPVEAGISTSAQSWGPGIRGNLLLGPNAPGIPRLFVRTARPIATALGNFSGTVFIGTLSESPFFDTIPGNNLRTLGAFTMAWSPGDSSMWVLGIEHGGMRAGSWWQGTPIHGPADQINTFFARIRSPDDGFSGWTEIGRAGRLPTSKNFFTVPYQGITYIVGVEQAIPVGSSTLLLSGEAADLEQPTDIRGQPTQDFYTSNDIPQGWTQRGRLLGDQIGPGGNSQWASGDWVGRRWSAGIFLERVRWNEDALLRQYLPYDNRHDVTTRAGIRGSAVIKRWMVSLELSTADRLDYLFQNGNYIPGLYTADVRTPQITVSFSHLVTPFQ